MKIGKSPILAFLFTAMSLSSHAALVAHWKLDETSGTTAADSAGGDNTGTLNNGPSWVTGTIGGGLDFDGSNDYVSAPLLTTIPTGSAARTISVWFNADVNNVTGMAILSYGDGGGVTGGGGADPNPFGDAFTLTFEDSGKIYFRYSGGNNQYNLAGNTNLSINTWYHLAAVVPDNATGTNELQVYLNGALANTTATGTVQSLFTDPTTALPDFYLGAVGPNNNFFNGTIDDVQIYDSALSATDIASLYNNPGSVIPEPSSALMLGLFGSLALLRRRC